ncbi:hypothetical protein [Nonomuraea sp. NPDC050310]|uniref:hypothetical protein n=1 Tax=unclassified Nonomuraea TaxID=2593643 RepID=UPI0033E104B3
MLQTTPPAVPATTRALAETDPGYVRASLAPVTVTPAVGFAAGVVAGYALAKAIGALPPQPE